MMRRRGCIYAQLRSTLQRIIGYWTRSSSRSISEATPTDQDINRRLQFPSAVASSRSRAIYRLNEASQCPLCSKPLSSCLYPRRLSQVPTIFHCSRGNNSAARALNIAGAFVSPILILAVPPKKLAASPAHTAPDWARMDSQNAALTERIATVREGSIFSLEEQLLLPLSARMPTT